MTRMTEKLSAALRILQISEEPTHPAIVYYGRLAEMGWKWTGEQWEQNGPPFQLSYPAAIRVMTDGLIDNTLLSNFLERSLRDAGWKVERTTARPNRDLNGYRTYLTIE